MLALDHIVIGGSNAVVESAAYSRKHTIKVLQGGTHTEWGTYNYLSYFSNNCYLEWLDICDYQIAKQTSNPLIKHLRYQVDKKRSGPFQFALRTDNMDSYMDHFLKNNISYKGPYYGSRATPNDGNISWRMLFPSYDHTKETLPFLIEWDTPMRERITPSVVNAEAIQTLTFTSCDKAHFAAIYKLMFNKWNRNSLLLSNATLQFSDKGELHYTLV